MAVYTCYDWPDCPRIRLRAVKVEGSGALRPRGYRIDRPSIRWGDDARESIRGGEDQDIRGAVHRS